MAKNSTEGMTKKRPANKSGKVKLTEQELQDEDLDSSIRGGVKMPYEPRGERLKGDRPKASTKFISTGNAEGGIA